MNLLISIYKTNNLGILYKNIILDIWKNNRYYLFMEECMKAKKTAVLVLFFLVSMSVLVFGQGNNEKDINKVVIAQQFGLGYAPLMVMEKHNLITKYYPEAEVEWVQLGSGGAIREAMAANRVDIGSMGVPPFLIGWAKDYNWKVISGLCYMPLGLQTYHEKVKTLADIDANMKIALPSPGSIQHILLSMAAEKQLGDARALDNNLVAMAHPDGANALINQVEIDLHFTSPPYIFAELNSPNIHQVVDAETDSFGGSFTFLVSAATKDFTERNPDLFDAVFQAFDEAIRWLEENTQEAAELLSEELNTDKKEIERQLEWPGVRFDKNPTGMLTFLEFMKEQGYVEKETRDIEELIWYTIDASASN